MMRVDFERTGGFAGMRQVSGFDLDDLSPEEALQVRQLLDEARFQELPERLLGEGAMPDQFTYKVTVTSETWTHTIVTGDTAAPETLRPLLDKLNELARQRRVQGD